MQPVIDLANLEPADNYVPSKRLRCGMVLAFPNEPFPFSQRDSVEVLKGMGVSIDGMLACGGGGSSKLWRQMLADTYNCAVRTVVSKEGPALGVAILAGVGAGLYPSVQEGCRRVIRLNAPQEPIEENVPKYEAFYRMYTKLYPALKDCYKELAAL